MPSRWDSLERSRWIVGVGSDMGSVRDQRVAGHSKPLIWNLARGNGGSELAREGGGSVTEVSTGGLLSRASSLLHGAGQGWNHSWRSLKVLMIVPTLCVGMPQGTLRVPALGGRRASRAAFPRGAWERSTRKQ